MKKFLEELVVYIWIPFIVGLVTYIFLELHDISLGVATLIGFSAFYVTVRIYFLSKKWWLFIVLAFILLGLGAYFFARPQGITLSVNGETVTGPSVSFTEGSVSVNPAPGSDGGYAKNTGVSLTASPASGYDWQSWSGTDNDTSNPTTLTMSGTKQVKATFAPRFSLIINNQLVIGSVVSFTDGSVLVTPAPGTDGKYTRDTVITLTANPASGYDWRRWTVTSSDASNPTTVEMNSNKQVTVTFAPRFSLTIGNEMAISSSVSLPEGSVTVDPPPGPDDKYAKDTVVTLTANPASAYGWKNWLGTGKDASNPTTVTMSSDKHVAVVFEPRFWLTINNQAVTSSSVNFTQGTVSINPAPGMDGRYSKDVAVSFVVTPASGYRFDRWSGEIANNNLTMNANKSITANFVRIYTLTAAVSPAGGGLVSPSSGTYDEGAAVSLAATPSSGYRFDHWSVDASGAVPTTTITMNADKHVTATFVKLLTLTVSVSPVGGGSVSPSSGTYDEGVVVVLTATPAVGYRFDRWSGDVSGSATSTTVTMSANRSVTANFIKVP